MEPVSNETICPACGYDLGFQPWKGKSSSDEICPCCGIQFGYHDATSGGPERQQQIYAEWRNNWIKEGMIWDRGDSEPPAGWNPVEQLKRVS